MNLIFDTHAHYDDEAFVADREALLASMPENGVGLIVDPGCDLDTSRRAVNDVLVFGIDRISGKHG